ncbi:D-2-hydroxyacid dehydrogenase family protein, partial [Streptomyces sp. SID6648]|nr:D-2-hydroxyacid dehydrogenase family protein [Streptomyces sp. SID6648]
MRLRCAVLDDYQRVATEVADWSPVADAVDVVVHDTHYPDEDTLAAALADVDIVVTLRERVPFPGSLIARLP